MNVEDYYPQGKRWWVPLHEKGGKQHEMPTHHLLEASRATSMNMCGRPASVRKRPLPSSAH
jgi:hypothetical protein